MTTTGYPRCRCRGRGRSRVADTKISAPHIRFILSNSSRENIGVSATNGSKDLVFSYTDESTE